MSNLRNMPVARNRRKFVGCFSLLSFSSPTIARPLSLKTLTPMTPAPRLLTPLLRSAWSSSNPPLRTSSTRFLSSSSSLLSRSPYRRFGDPARPDPPPEASSAAPQGDPWSIIRKLPTGSRRGGRGGGGSPFGDIKYRATTLLKQPLVLVLLAGGGSYYVIHLEQSPTGRWRFMDVDPQTEQEMAKQSYDEVMQQYGGRVLGNNSSTTKYVKEVVRRIVEGNGLDADGNGGTNGWEVFVVQDDQTQNAWVHHLSQRPRYARADTHKFAVSSFREARSLSLVASCPSRKMRMVSR